MFAQGASYADGCTLTGQLYILEPINMHLLTIVYTRLLPEIMGACAVGEISLLDPAFRY